MRHGHRILLLEDDPEDARRCRDALVENGYAVIHAPTLSAARRAIRRPAVFDFVIVDHHLPDGEGPTIIPHLRAAGITAPVLMVTGNRSERVAKEAFEAGCVDTAIKDLDYQSWLPQVAQALGGDAQAVPAGWGPHVKGICAGRLHGHSLQTAPAEAWHPYHLVLQSAVDLALRAVRAAGQSTLGSLPAVQVTVRADLHLLVVLRGGVFAGALLDQPATASDQEELVAEAAAYSKARSESEDLGSGAAPM